MDVKSSKQQINKPIGEIMLRWGYITQEQLTASLQIQEQNGGLLGEILVENGFISAADFVEFIFSSRSSRLGERLLQAELITPAQLRTALQFQEENGDRIGNILVSLGYIKKEALDEFLAAHVKPRMTLGQMLVQDGEITDEQLQKALDLQKKTGGHLGEILLFLRYITPEVLSRYLSTQNNIGRIGRNFEQEVARQLPYEIAIKYNAVLFNRRDDVYLVAVAEILDEAAVREIQSYLDKPLVQVLATMAELENFEEAVYGRHLVRDSIFKLYDDQPENSALVVLSKKQKVAFLILAIIMLNVFLWNHSLALFTINIVIQIFYAIMAALKVFILLKGLKQEGQLRFADEEVSAIDEKELPVYTILIPVYKEKEVITRLINNIKNLDYPSYKLDVRILLEEDDVETIALIRKMDLPFYFTPLIVPSSKPKTKPKACNYGLLRARGKFVVIYDAEDRPEPDQLKKVFLAFKKLPPEYVCIQCKLNYFNSRQNALTKLFTQEYSMWFDLLLVGIMKVKMPIPLGGTSNHFKIDFLREAGAWDPFNVTEDADLGMRLFKKNYKTAVVDSRTWEEANSNVINWIRQRSRWIKGYMQTWLVHMRHPVQLYRNCGFQGFVGFQAMIFGTPFLPLVNPFFWLLLVLWYATSAGWISALFPGVIYYIAAIQLILGNFMFIYINAVGMYWVIGSCGLQGRQPFSYGLIKYALLAPFYWVLMSIASYVALFQLIKKPFYWEKTTHGLTMSEHDSVDNSQLNHVT